MVMAKLEDDMLAELSEQIDAKLFEWIRQYKIEPLSLSGAMLARLCWLAKLGDYENDFLTLLEHPKEVIHIDDNSKDVFH